MSTTQFVRLHEINDHEGEAWNFWLQLDGNEEAIGALAKLIEQATAEWTMHDDYPFALDLDEVEPEDVVDKLVEYAEEGYMASHTKVTGTLVLTDLTVADLIEQLYKGSIKEMFS